LHRALGLKPWEANPLEVESGDELMRPGTAWASTVTNALALRKELEADSLQTEDRHG
jgi:hypothetical protein